MTVPSRSHRPHRSSGAARRDHSRRRRRDERGGARAGHASLGAPGVGHTQAAREVRQGHEEARQAHAAHPGRRSLASAAARDDADGRHSDCPFTRRHVGASRESTSRTRNRRDGRAWLDAVRARGRLGSLAHRERGDDPADDAEGGGNERLASAALPERAAELRGDPRRARSVRRGRGGRAHESASAGVSRLRRDQRSRRANVSPIRMPPRSRRKIS